MKITNSTRFETRRIRSIVCAVAARLARSEGKLAAWRHMRVAITYTRQFRGPSGLAAIGGAWIRLRIPSTGCNVAQFAAVVEHELLHSYGHKHDAIGCRITPAHWRAQDWAREQFGPVLLLPPRAPKMTPAERVEHVGALAAKRLELLRARLERWERKSKAAARMVAKLRAKVRERERRHLRIAASRPQA